jgi:hypothetical protein
MHGNIQLSYDIRCSIVYHVIKSWERFKVWTDDGNGDNIHVKERYRVEMLKSTT